MRIVRRVLVTVIGMWIAVAISEASGAGRPKEVSLGDQAASKRREVIAWHVNRPIVGFRVELRAGKGIINTVQFFRDGRKTDEFAFGVRMVAGQDVVKTLGAPMSPQQIKVSSDANEGATYRLIVSEAVGGGIPPRATEEETTEAESREAGTRTIDAADLETIDLGTVRPGQRRQVLIFDVGRPIVGYLVEVQEGRAIIRTVQCTGAQPRLDHRYGRYFSDGERIEKMLDAPTNVVELRVNTDANNNAEYRVVVYVERE